MEGVSEAGNRRQHPRLEARLPISIEEEQGVTRDISLDGMFIVQSHEQEIGSTIEFWLHLRTPMGVMKLRCEGEVSRTEEVDGKVGVGVRILRQFGRRLVLEDLGAA